MPAAVVRLSKVSRVPRHAWRATLGFRALAASLLLLLGTATVGRGYCPMRSPAQTRLSKADPHDCCKKGLTDAKPRCCHAGNAADAVALLKNASPVLLSAAYVGIPSVPVEAASAHSPANPAFVSHSPPVRILRI